jgi:hypothetical protein
MYKELRHKINTKYTEQFLMYFYNQLYIYKKNIAI